MGSSRRPRQIVMSADTVLDLPPQLLLTLQVAVFRVASASTAIAAALSDDLRPTDAMDSDVDFLLLYQQRHLTVRSLNYQGPFAVAFEPKAFRDNRAVLFEAASVIRSLLAPAPVSRSRREARAIRNQQKRHQSASIAAAAVFVPAPLRDDATESRSGDGLARESRRRRLYAALDSVAASHLNRTTSPDARSSAAILVERFRQDSRLSSSLHNLRTLRFAVDLRDDHSMPLAADH